MVQALQGPSIEERVAQLQQLLDDADPQVRKEYQERFDIAWIYHDSALEGVVYSMDELKAAIYDEVISDPSLIPVYDEIRNHMGAIEMIREMSSRRRFAVNLEVIKKLFAQLAPEELEGKGPPKYRKDMPLHRLYFHEISQPDKISYRMRQLVQWLTEPETKKSMHPVRMASKAHYQLLHIYPFPRHSGKVARLVMNLILMRAGYPPVVIHATERQRYYEALRNGEDATANLVNQALGAAIETAIQYFEEINR
ncbi:MAG: Fic family protein [Polyangiales bacterium]